MGYKGAKKVNTLGIFLPKLISYRKDINETKFMSFLIKDDELLEQYNEIQKKLKIFSKKNSIVNSIQ